MLAFHRRWMQKTVLGLIGIYALREVNRRFSERIDSFFEANPEEIYPMIDLAQFWLIGFLFILYTLVFAVLIILVTIFVFVLFSNNEAKQQLANNAMQNPLLDGQIPSNLGLQEADSNGNNLNLLENAKKFANLKDTKNLNPFMTEVNSNDDAPEHEDNDNDDGFITFFFNSFFIYWIIQCIIYSIIHFCVFCIYITVTHQQRAMDNSTYVKSVLFYYLNTYALGVYTILFMV
jgi:hypothetical protein